MQVNNCIICNFEMEHPIDEKSLSGGVLTNELECTNCSFRCFVTDFEKIRSRIVTLETQIIELQEYKDANEAMIDWTSRIVIPEGDEGFAVMLNNEQIKEVMGGG